MTKEEFIELMPKEEIPIEALHECFMEMTGTPVQIDNFERMLVTATRQGTAIKGSTGMKQVTYTSIVDKFYGYYKAKFGL